jgi:hypothetical protein
VVGNGVSFAKVLATSLLNPHRSFVREVISGAWGDYVPVNGNSVLFHGAVANGVTNDAPAFSAAVAAQVANRNDIPAYSSILCLPNVTVFVPAMAGAYHLSSDVVLNNRFVNWIVDPAAKFTPGSVARLKGRVNRGSRFSLGAPRGDKDHATALTVNIGEDVSDNPALVFGITATNQVGLSETLDLCGLNISATGMPLLHGSAATYTATTAVLSSAPAADVVALGDYMQTAHSPTPYRAQITGISGDRLTFTYAGGWLPVGTGSTTPVTPSNVGAPACNFGPYGKVWGQNVNTFLLPSSFTYQSVVSEGGVYNNKVTPTRAEDSAGRVCSYDAVNLGRRKFSIGFIARGAGFEGFRATGQDIGFNAAAYASLGYAAPGVGFQYTGAGASLASFNASGLNCLYLTPSTMDFGIQGAAATTSIEFHSGAIATDFDGAIRASGGDGTAGNGTLTLDVLLTLSRHFRLAVDNT